MQTKFDFLRSHSLALFSDTVRPRYFKFFLYINPYGYSLQKKFYVPQSNSFREKLDDILIRIYNYVHHHRIFLKNCATEEDQIIFAMSIHMG